MARVTRESEVKVRCRLLRSGLASTVVALAAALALFSSAANASVAGDERAGAAILAAVEAGKQDCSSLSTADFERVGDYVMGRMLGSASAHESADRVMSEMMGERLEQSAHVVMGRRFTRCGGTDDDPGFNGMMGMMGGLYAGGSGGMMGGGYGAGPGGMMGETRFGIAGDDDWDGAEIAMVALMGLLLLGLVAGLMAWKPWRPSATVSPLDELRARLARGEIEPDEFESRRQALGGGGG